jgi:hypothetical protein
MNRALVGMVVGLGLAAGTGTASAQSATPAPIARTGCVEHEVWADGDATAVAQRLPSKYTAATDGGTGAPLIFARAERCGDLVLADYGIVINSPDGYGCASGIPQVGPQVGNLPPMCDWYTLALVANDQSLVDWLHAGTPGIPVTYVPGLTYQETDSTLHFAAAAPAPSAFTIDDTYSFRPGAISLRGAYYFPDVPQGTVRMLVSTDDLEAGRAVTTLRAAAGSELAAIMGATERPSLEPYSEFGVIRVGHGVLRKQLTGPPLTGETVDSFAGSCSVQGDVTFDPPATDTQKPEHYAYDSKGTCTGTLDGKALSNAPVTLQQAGHADASCLQALAFPPGEGELVFGNGVRLPFTLDFTSKGTELDGTAYGTRSGLAPGHGTFATQRTDAAAVTTACAGDGVKTAPMDMTFSTSSPLLSSRFAPAAQQHTPAARRTHKPKKHRRHHHKRHRRSHARPKSRKRAG